MSREDALDALQWEWSCELETVLCDLGLMIVNKEYDQSKTEISHHHNHM